MLGLDDQKLRVYCSFYANEINFGVTTATQPRNVQAQVWN